MSRAFEVNFDGIVGPTHNYAGLSFGNIASMTNAKAASNPKQAALEGLAKMKFCFDLGLKQAVLPPHERPHIPTLRRLGYTGDDASILAKVDRPLLAAVSSSSAMWAANAATVSPSADTSDGRVHFTPANLISNLHRSIEADTTSCVLRTIFADEAFFAHHPPLPSALQFSDEGAANHTRLCADYGVAGFELFVYGEKSAKFPARQSEAAAHAIARSHQVRQVIFLRQSAAAIDAGAFHNDVVAVGNRDLLIYHEHAWDDALPALNVRTVKISNSELPIADAISSYLFNSQLITLEDGTDAIIAPIEVKENEHARAALDRIPAKPYFVDVRQSMRNGGGPACLRLRVVLTERELAATHQGVLFTNKLHDQLAAWINRNYRDHLTTDDLADPKLLDESRRALDELTQILCLGSIYEFQSLTSATGRQAH